MLIFTSFILFDETTSISNFEKIIIYPISSETNLNDDNCSLRLSK